MLMNGVHLDDEKEEVYQTGIPIYREKRRWRTTLCDSPLSMQRRLNEPQSEGVDYMNTEYNWIRGAPNPDYLVKN